MIDSSLNQHKFQGLASLTMMLVLFVQTIQHMPPVVSIILKVIEADEVLACG